MLAIRQIKTSRIREFAHDEPVETLVIMPSTRMAQAQRAARSMALRTRKNGLVIIAEDDCRLGFIPTANLVYAKTRSQFVAYVAQDAFPGFFWLEYAVDTMKKSGAGFVPFNDGLFFGKMAAFGLARREWLSSIYGNLLFYPRYTKHFGDVELTDIARGTGSIAYEPHSIMMEVDYNRFLPDEEKAQPDGNRERSLPGERQVQKDDSDGILYVKRALTGFDGRIEPIVPVFGPVAEVINALSS